MHPATGYPSSILHRQLARRHGGAVLFFLVFLGISLLTRCALLVKAAHDVTWTFSLVASFLWGLVYDLGAAAFASLPLTIVLTVLPAGWFQRKWQQALAHLGGFLIIYVLLFGLVAEWTFWDEFGVRFNFIAVDYLVYTHEVVGNIRESYNLPLIFSGVLLGAAVVHWLVWRSGLPARWFAAPAEKFGTRARSGAPWFVLPLLYATLLTGDRLPDYRNNYNRELGKNGLWALFAAFWNNELAFDQFYPTVPDAAAFRVVREELARDRSVTLGSDPLSTLHVVRNPGPERRLNAIQITVESLSGEFLGSLNPGSKLTPQLDALVTKSLFFDNLYATGTRTVRGMEALTLSLPPTPGRSIVKRPHNEGLFTLGAVFRSRGYDTAFIYGGHGYFDNMNYFFGHNGYRLLDRMSVKQADVTFANVWGACDEDLFRWTLREADADAAAGRPFHFFLMTTSNHRPYTYPDGRIDLPSKTSGRAGGVKYTDFAIGQFIREAEAKPWGKNTVFVIVADHCASSAGKSELPVQNYHIPLIIYAPGGQIAAGRIHTLASQVDFAPTLLGLLGWSYPSRFFGRDVRQIDPAEGRALIGTYQKLGLLHGEDFFVLSPVRREAQYRYNPQTFTLTPQPADPDFRARAIGYFQAASDLYQKRQYGELGAEDFARVGPEPAAK